MTRKPFQNSPSNQIIIFLPSPVLPSFSSLSHAFFFTYFPKSKSDNIPTPPFLPSFSHLLFYSISPEISIFRRMPPFHSFKKKKGFLKIDKVHAKVWMHETLMTMRLLTYSSISTTTCVTCSSSSTLANLYSHGNATKLALPVTQKKAEKHKHTHVNIPLLNVSTSVNELSWSTWIEKRTCVVGCVDDDDFGMMMAWVHNAFLFYISPFLFSPELPLFFSSNQIIYMATLSPHKANRHTHRAWFSCGFFSSIRWQPSSKTPPAHT